jgi:uncharacterized protein (UPF0332 family)
MKVADCLANNLLSKTEPDMRKAKKSILAAERKLKLAEAELKNELYEGCFVSAYATMFHAARALLFRDGYKERSHFAVFTYLDEKYSNKIEKRLITEFNNMRTDRHNLMYGLDEPQETSEQEAKATIKIVKEFIEAIKEILKE